ncbi:MAG: hypothetical protein IPP48_10305 [Chitinophagaceae bacterium]|nr:hypothetical protein [Chitinophagaceae bacterium]
MQTNLEKLFDVNINIPKQNSIDELIQNLSVEINELINTNFEKLISILYRMDVSEQKIKHLLAYNNRTNAGVIIATLMVERELQKIKSRAEFAKKSNDLNEDEKW